MCRLGNRQPNSMVAALHAVLYPLPSASSNRLPRVWETRGLPAETGVTCGGRMAQMRVSAENPTWDRAYLDSKRLSVWNRRPSPITLFPVGGAIAARACAFSLALLAL